jgi:hypothetical protein
VGNNKGMKLHTGRTAGIQDQFVNQASRSAAAPGWGSPNAICQKTAFATSPSAKKSAATPNSHPTALRGRRAATTAPTNANAENTIAWRSAKGTSTSDTLS